MRGSVVLHRRLSFYNKSTKFPWGRDTSSEPIHQLTAPRAVQHSCVCRFGGPVNGIIYEL